ncbi:MAG: mechanosensitive ion channel [Candidatus Nitrosocaldaceae archaeon]
MEVIESTLALSISTMTTMLGALGFSLAFKDYIASLIAGMIFKRSKRIKIGTRIKILTNPIIKGDIIEIGFFRTTLEEVGEGERLSSIKTGKILKVPNFLLFNNPVVLYGEKTIDEVIAYVNSDLIHFDYILIDNMKRAIEEEGHKVIDVNIKQHSNGITIHGVYESYTKNISDIRERILERYIKMNNKINK